MVSRHISRLPAYIELRWKIEKELLKYSVVNECLTDFGYPPKIPLACSIALGLPIIPN